MTAPTKAPGALRYPHLFQPGQIGRMQLRNRIVVPAHSTNLGEQGRPTDRQIAYYRARAAGGAAMIVIGGVRIHPTTISSGRALRGFDPAAIDDFRRLADAIKAEGAVIVAQLLHVGREVNSYESGRSLWSASDKPSPMNREIPHRMTLAEIDECLHYYQLSAEHMRAAGFDGVEIHAAHGYLIQQFLSPLVNDRDDQYGGSLENRMRFGLEVIEAVRRGAGDMAVGLRVSGDEFTEGGLGLPDMVEIAPRFAATGIDYLSVSHCTYVGPSFVTMIPDMHQPKGAYVYLAEAIKAAVPPELPVFTVGRITDPEMAEEILAAGKADYVAMARATIADPDLPRKALEGREAEVRPCISCNQGCVGMVHAMRPILCLQNPVTGRELQWGAGTLHPAPRPKKVLVIGGGVAGMEAAIVARQRGHDVTIWEDTTGLGGFSRWASMPLGRQDFKGSYTWRKQEVRRLGVKVRLGRHATAEMVREFKPDAVILATGALPVDYRYLLPGAEKERILSVENMIIEGFDPGQNIVFIDDDGYHRAAGVAEGLARLGKRVDIVTPLASVGQDIIPMSGIGVLLRLRELGVRMHTNSTVTSVDGPRVEILNALTGQTTHLIDIDGFVVAGRRKSRDELYPQLIEFVPQVIVVGDALAPRKAHDAIREGHAAGRAV